MHSRNLRSIDLNLLVIFHALAEERNVTRAADRLHLTQPAVSHALARLRGLLGDRLFVRGPGAMEATPFATEIAPRIAALLDEVASVLTPLEIFDPSATKRQFIIGMSDYAAVVLGAPLAERMCQFPSVTTIIRQTSHGSCIDMLDNGETELNVGILPPRPNRMSGQSLLVEDLVCVFRAGHPIERQDLTLPLYLTLHHLHVSAEGEPAGLVDQALGRLRKRRHVAMTVSSVLASLYVLARTDLVNTGSRRLLEPLAHVHGLTVAPLPFEVPAIGVSQMWPRRFDSDGGHRWLRQQIADIAAALQPD